MKENPAISSASFFVGKSGDDIISFGSGQPDLPPPKEIYEILPTYKAFKYGLIQGQQNLREALAPPFARGQSASFTEQLSSAINGQRAGLAFDENDENFLSI